MPAWIIHDACHTHFKQISLTGNSMHGRRFSCNIDPLFQGYNALQAASLLVNGPGDGMDKSGIDQ